MADDGKPHSAKLDGFGAGAAGPGRGARTRRPTSSAPPTSRRVRRAGANLGGARPRHLSVAQLLQLGQGSVLELDRKVGEAIDIYVNNRLVARGEVVVVDERLGVTMTEIIKDGDAADAGNANREWRIAKGAGIESPAFAVRRSHSRSAHCDRRRKQTMRLLVVGTLSGQLSSAVKLAMAGGAQGHARRDLRRRARAARRPGRGPPDGRLRLDIRDLIAANEAERIRVPVVACGVATDARAAATPSAQAPRSSSRCRPTPT